VLAAVEPTGSSGITNSTLSSDILDKIYLGMPTADVYGLFGEPDYQASGLMWFGYNDVGIFDVMDSFTENRADVM
jgi:hypothetical protein